MANRFNIKFTIQAVDRFSANMEKLERKLDAVQRKADNFDLNRDVKITADTAQALNDITVLQRRLDAVDRQAKKKRDLEFRTKHADKALSRISRVIGDMNPTEIDIDADTRGAMTNLRRVDSFMSDLNRNNRVIRTKMEMDTGGAERSLRRISRVMDGVTDMHINARLDDTLALRGIRNIERRANELGRKRFEANIRVNADTRDAMRSLQTIARRTDRVMANREDYVLGFNTLPATNALRNLNRIANDVTEDRNIRVDTDLAGASAQMAGFRALQENLDMHVRVAADTRRASAEMFTWRALMSRPMVVRIRANASNVQGEFKKLQSRIGRIASLSRNVGEALMFQLSTFLTTFVTAIIPIIATTVANLANIGVMIGTASGATLGLATSFGAAGAAAVAFGALAKNALSEVFEVQDDLARLQEKYDLETDAEKRLEILAEMKARTELLSSEQQRALEVNRELKGTWDDLAQSMQPQIIDTYSGSVTALTSVINALEPMFRASADAAERLVESLNVNLESADMQAFFDFLNTHAGPALETLSKSMGNFAVGILNLMTAFAPLSVEMQDGLLGMSERFREWTASLSESDSFQKFVDYVRTNWPKVKEIFGDGILGMVAMISAFAPAAESFMDNLVDMMNKFRDWAETLGSNDDFQKFIDYVIKNGPQVTSLIGSFVDLLISLGKAIAPIGEFALEAASSFLDFFTYLNDNYPIIAQIGAGIVSLAGVFTMFTIPLTLARTAIKLLWPVVKLLGSAFLTAGKFIFQWGRILFGLAGPIAWIIAIVSLLAYAIYKNWGTIGPWISDMWEKVKENMDLAWKAIKALVHSALTYVAEWIATKMLEAKSSVDTIIEGIKAIFNAKVEAIKKKWSENWSNIKGDAEMFLGQIKENVNNVLQAVVGYFAEKLATAVRYVTTRFTLLKKAFRLGMEAAKEIVSNAIEAIKDFFDIDLSASGEGMINSVAAGIRGAVGAVTSAVSWVAGKARAFLPFSPAKEGPLSDLDRLNFGGTIAKSIYRDTGTVRRAMATLMSHAQPELALANGAGNNAYRGAGGQYDAAIRDRANRGRQVVEVPVYLDSREIAHATTAETTRLQKRNANVNDKFRGGGRR